MWPRKTLCVIIDCNGVEVIAKGRNLFIIQQLEIKGNFFDKLFFGIEEEKAIKIKYIYFINYIIIN